MPNKHDDWGYVRDSEGNMVANTCTCEAAESFRNDWDGVNDGEWRAGPPQARVVAELLIRARAESDDKPVTGEWLDSLGGELLDDDDNDWTFTFRIRGDSRVRLYVWSDLTITFGDTDYRPKCQTRGKFLKLCEALDVITTEKN